MSLVVENGTGLSTADSYVSVADADAYHLSMNHAHWTGSTSHKEAALRRATQYIDSHYRFRGWRRYPLTQRLEWPRAGFEPEGERSELIWPPVRLRDAVCELALRALTATLDADASTDAVIEETVGPITVRYAGKSGQTRYTVADSLLRPYILGGAAGLIRLERAT